MDRRTALRGSAAAFGALALTAVATGNLAEASPGRPPGLMPDPAATPVPNPPYPHNLTHDERRHLETFDELDFTVFSHADWNRLGESHSRTIRVHWPDGHYTDGIDRHIADLAAMFVWAPDTRIHSHPLRIAKNELTAVTGVMQGTFTRPMPDGKGGFVKPTGKSYAINMATIGLWNRRGTMDEEFLFWDNQNFYQQLGLA
ncbi:ester cyclase [Amycolatopsis rhabdoformis]|uniref:Ester cyclase n=1 Tax=Amycolatopsis rhabdoformis TaxID=1448059 RepID=A0ABZ1IL23_9PSEU|nr:ester cyclase [Amycolatopsis rhabdoformis]WSE34195.1 ester cyclase [Amycolatopsis rhabdoformis]